MEKQYTNQPRSLGYLFLSGFLTKIAGTYLRDAAGIGARLGDHAPPPGSDAGTARTLIKATDAPLRLNGADSGTVLWTTEQDRQLTYTFGPADYPVVGEASVCGRRPTRKC
ncbi:hypothetical protein FRUB_04743 [Fimbriiglobus ruber]|uniref:Uncharacterized protein n=1 Tax=Fimbriiglobus ruber TaxID=1908690 RepID=A0A225DH64_9BACT|nr:hypothetical protein FRUB_04743 [Fimbriiglobus ruber]